jgi:uncharacterized membrane protein (DUF106 family)
MDTQGKEGSFAPIIIIMALSLIIASFWNSIPAIKNSVGAILNPSAGALLNWNLTYGMVIIVFIFSLFTTIIQKYATDQKTMKEMRDEQKRLSEEVKKFEGNLEKKMELQKESMKFMMPMMKLSMRGVMFTGIPFVLFFRWFSDFFSVMADFRFFGFLNWFWLYLLGSIIFSSIFRKILKVV